MGKKSLSGWIYTLYAYIPLTRVYYKFRRYLTTDFANALKSVYTGTATTKAWVIPPFVISSKTIRLH